MLRTALLALALATGGAPAAAGDAALRDLEVMYGRDFGVWQTRCTVEFMGETPHRRCDVALHGFTPRALSRLFVVRVSMTDPSEARLTVMPPGDAGLAGWAPAHGAAPDPLDCPETGACRIDPAEAAALAERLKAGDPVVFALRTGAGRTLAHRLHEPDLARAWAALEEAGGRWLPAREGG